MADFGLMKFFKGDQGEKLGTKCGTISYMAPELFGENKVDVLAGLRPGLLADSERLEGRVLEGRFTTVQQAIGTLRANKVMAEFLAKFVENSKRNGLIEGLIKKHGMEGRLLVAG